MMVTMRVVMIAMVFVLSLLESLGWDERRLRHGHVGSPCIDRGYAVWHCLVE